MYRRLMAGFLSMVLFPLLFASARQPTHIVATRLYTNSQSLPAQQAAAQVQFGGALGFHYSPEVVFISPGDTVTWQGDFSMHPLVSDDGLWPTNGSGSQFSHSFDQLESTITTVLCMAAGGWYERHSSGR
jgi:plastocyanin